MTKLHDLLGQYQSLTTKKELLESIIGLLGHSGNSTHSMGPFPDDIREEVSKEIEHTLLRSVAAQLEKLENVEVKGESEGKKSTSEAGPKTARRISVSRAGVRAKGS